ncbi:hypothetical protein V3478_33400, partial [Pseudomonas aeruginosa]|uniref:hypothetical protein n=1 Tax=Pseudomonas aeruginosa TaxID=287 RepID=UPI002F9482FD
EALQAVNLLDANKKGKANFFILDKLSERNQQHHQPANTLAALNVIEVDAQFSKLAEHLLGNVFIAETEDAIENSNGAIVLEKT